MTFSYSTGLSADKDKVRYHIDDVVLAAGPLPRDGAASNFADEELVAIIALEGSWQRAVAACFERLASAWTLHPTFQDAGLALSRSHIALGFRNQAAEWRQMYGRGTDTSGYRVVTRQDAFSSDLDAVSS